MAKKGEKKTKSKKTTKKSKNSTKRKTTKKRTTKSKNDKIIETLTQNFTSLQGAIAKMSLKFDTLSNKIESLLNVFEESAKSLAKKDFKDFEKYDDKELSEKIDNILDQNKTIAKGLIMLHEKETFSQPIFERDQSTMNSIKRPQQTMKQLPKIPAIQPQYNENYNPSFTQEDPQEIFEEPPQPNNFQYSPQVNIPPQGNQKYSQNNSPPIQNNLPLPPQQNNSFENPTHTQELEDSNQYEPGQLTENLTNYSKSIMAQNDSDDAIRPQD